MALLSYYLVVFADSRYDVLVIIGTLTFGALKVLPNIQMIYTSVSALRQYSYSLMSIIDILKNNLVNKSYGKKVKLNDQIQFNNIKFKYPNLNKIIINDINLSFKKSQKIVILGETGSGKSTLLDLIMGLLKPTNGEIYIDNKLLFSATHNKYYYNLRSLISHVPQNIYLINASIIENIAFNEKKSKINLTLLKNY